MPCVYVKEAGVHGKTFCVKETLWRSQNNWAEMGCNNRSSNANAVSILSSSLCYSYLQKHIGILCHFHIFFYRNILLAIWLKWKERFGDLFCRGMFHATFYRRMLSHIYNSEHITMLASTVIPRRFERHWQSHYFANKGPSGQDCGFSSGHVWMWELDYKESWALKNWWFWTVVLEKTLESLLDCKEIQPVHPKGDQSWVFIGRTDAEAETPILWPPDVKSWLIWKDSGAGKDWRREEKGMTGWDGLMASPARLTWGWVNSGSWWWTGRPGVLWFMGSQTVGHNWATELN